MSGCGTHSCNECIRWREQVEAELAALKAQLAEAIITERAVLVEGLLDLLSQMESIVASEDEFDVVRAKLFDYANSHSPPGLRFVIDAVLARERGES